MDALVGQLCHAPHYYCQPEKSPSPSNAQAEVELDDPKVRSKLAVASRGPRHSRRKKPQSEHGSMGREGKKGGRIHEASRPWLHRRRCGAPVG
jgi:hypothetical protein